MRQLAWLNAVPRAADPKPNQAPNRAAPRPDAQTRADRMRAQGMTEPPLPPISPAAAPMLAWLMDVGPILNMGMGPVSVTHTELQAWQANNGIYLAPWQANALRNLSRLYLTELRANEAPDAAMPYVTAEQRHRDQVAAQIRRGMRALMAETAARKPTP